MHAICDVQNAPDNGWWHETKPLQFGKIVSISGNYSYYIFPICFLFSFLFSWYQEKCVQMPIMWRYRYTCCCLFFDWTRFLLLLFKSCICVSFLLCFYSVLFFASSSTFVWTCVGRISNSICQSYWFGSRFHRCNAWFCILVFNITKNKSKTTSFFVVCVFFFQ